MAEFQTVMRQRNRMCKQYKRCLSGCILADMLEDSGVSNCMQFAKAYPAEFESAVMTWAKNNPEKTMKEAVLEKFPKTALKEDGVPYICPHRLGLCESTLCPTDNCADCWNRPAPEE